MITFSILGCGRMGKRHAQILSQNPNVRINGFYDVDSSLAESLALEFNSKTYSSADSAIEDKDIQAVVISTPNSLHFEFLKKSIELNKDVLVEKPIVTTLEHCNKILDKMKYSKSKVMVGHTHRFYPCNLALKKLIDSREIGKIKLANTFDYIPGRLPGQKMPEWVKDQNLTGGGVFMTDFVHTVDKISWLFDSEIVKVYSPMLSSLTSNETVEDIGMATLWLKNGIVVNCVHGCPSPGCADMSIKIIGTEGEIDMEFAGKLNVLKDSLISIDYEGKGNSNEHTLLAFNQEINEFVSSILENRKPVVDYIIGIKAVKIILKLYESSKGDKPLVIE